MSSGNLVCKDIGFLHKEVFLYPVVSSMKQCFSMKAAGSNNTLALLTHHGSTIVIHWFSYLNV